MLNKCRKYQKYQKLWIAGLGFVLTAQSLQLLGYSDSNMAIAADGQAIAQNSDANIVMPSRTTNASANNSGIAGSVTVDSYPIQAIKVAAAGNSTTPAQSLAKLASDPSSFVRRALASHPKLSEEIKEKLAVDSDQTVVESLLKASSLPNLATLDKLLTAATPRVRETLAANPNTPQAILEKLSQGPVYTEFLLLSLARNPHSGPQVTNRLSRIGDRLVRTFLARLPVPQATFTTLANDGDLGVRSMVAGNSACPAALLDLLAKDSNTIVREAVALNQSTSKETLAKLATDSHQDVRQAVASNYASSAATLAQLAKDTNESVRALCAANPNTDIDVLTAMSKDNSTAVRCAVALNGNTKPETIKAMVGDNTIAVAQILAALGESKLAQSDYEKLANDQSALVRINLAGNGALSSSLIKTLAQDKDARVRASLAHNTKAKISDEIFVALAKDNDALVREALAVNSKVPSKLLTSLLQDDAITVQTALATNPNVAPLWP